MNLADAIRKAAKSQVIEEPTDVKPVTKEQEPAQEAPEEKTEVSKQSNRKEDEPKPSQNTDLWGTKQLDVSGTPPEPPSSAILSGNAVRLELFLSGEQMSAMLKAIMAGQHSVLTLREAASYLRVTPSTLEKWAEEGEVPAVDIDGRWRFPKTNLDEWLAYKASSTEEEKNVA